MPWPHRFKIHWCFWSNEKIIHFSDAWCNSHTIRSICIEHMSIEVMAAVIRPTIRCAQSVRRQLSLSAFTYCSQLRFTRRIQLKRNNAPLWSAQLVSIVNSEFANSMRWPSPTIHSWQQKHSWINLYRFRPLTFGFIQHWCILRIASTHIHTAKAETRIPQEATASVCFLCAVQGD